MTSINTNKFKLLGLSAAIAFTLSPLSATAFLDEKPAPEKPASEVKKEAKSKKDEKPEADAKDDEKESDKGKKGKKDKEPDFDELIEKHEKLEGFMTFYRHEKTGALKWSIPKEMVGKEFVHFIKVDEGTAAAGTIRGIFGNSALLKIERFFNRIEVRAVNTNFHFDEESAISRAKDANINSPILFTATIKAEHKETGDILVDADAMLLSEALSQIKSPQRPTPGPGPKPFSLGSLDKKATKVVDIDSYPENTDVVVEYAFKQSGAGIVRSRNAAMSLTDRRSVTLKFRHSFIELPENDYKPRFDDPRVGYFGERGNDMTNKDSYTPYHDMINRWHLVKQDPSAEISDPVEPIHWWIENTTPVEYRDAVKRGVLAWNKAFEAAGFSNAMKVSVQPDDAEWDAGDIRYNVIRWTASPQPFFGGYGPSFSDPRTGQLLGSDIMLEYASVARRDIFSKIYEAQGFSSSHDHDAVADVAQVSHAPIFESMQAGMAMLADVDASYGEQFTNDFIAYLTLHEVGHTLGLNHNMKSSQLHNATDVHNAELTKDVGLIGSVMDYPAANFAPQGVQQGEFYTTTPGPYDIWAIKFGYDPELDDPVKMAQHLAQSNKPELAFGNDADDMRSAGFGGIDPRIMIGDMSSEAVVYAQQRMDRIDAIVPSLKEKFSVEGSSYQGLVWATNALLREYQVQAGIVARYVGGVYVERGFVGQEGATQPYTPVELALQEQALSLLSEKLWAPEAFSWFADLAPYLQPQRRGFDFFGGTEDPKLLESIYSIQIAPLYHLMAPNVLRRLENTSLYGNEMTTEKLLAKLTEAMFAADDGTVVSQPRQNLQRVYVDNLIRLANQGGVSGQSVEAAARFELESLYSSMNSFFASSDSKAHRSLLKARIKKALDLD